MLTFLLESIGFVHQFVDEADCGILRSDAIGGILWILLKFDVEFKAVVSNLYDWDLRTGSDIIEVDSIGWHVVIVDERCS